MTLTTDDLKAIKKVVREEVKAEVKNASNSLEHQLRLTKMTLSNDMRQLDDRMKNNEVGINNIAESIDSLSNEMKDVKKSVNKIDKNVEFMLGFLDQQDVALHKRVTKIEKHLNLPQN